MPSLPLTMKMARSPYKEYDRSEKNNPTNPAQYGLRQVEEVGSLQQV
jgi:hypothetical protein